MNKKNVLVVGGSGGIGTHLVREFADAGYTVLATYYGHKEAMDGMQSLCSGIFQLNVSSEEECIKISNAIKENYGKLDALIYASGIFEDALTEDMPLSSWQKIIDINLTGAFLMTKHLLPLLRGSGDGRIVYIGSVMGEAGCYGSGSYSVTKAGLVALAKSVALENAKKNVTANVLSFGYIDTGMTSKVADHVLESAMRKIPMKRLGNPSDAAKVAVDLCTKHMNYVSGQTIRVNGALYV